MSAGKLTDGVNPTPTEIIQAIATHFECPEAVALSWVTQMFRHFDPKLMTEALAARSG